MKKENNKSKSNSGTIVLKLKKKPYPDGRLNFKFMLSKTGERDGKDAQLCIYEGKYLTPWILEKIRCLAAYKNKMYCNVDEALKPVAELIAAECKELELLTPGYAPKGLDPENQERLMAAFAGKQAALKARKKEILIHLSEWKMELESVNAALEHHLQEAENVVMKHIAYYWRGILKTSGETNLPPRPDVEMPEIVGQDIYIAHFRKICQVLEEGLTYGRTMEPDRMESKYQGGVLNVTI